MAEAEREAGEHGAYDVEPRVTHEQHERLISFMKRHRQMVLPAQEFRPGDTARDRAVLWDAITKELNSVGPPFKNSRRWRRYWGDLRREAIRRAAALHRDMQGVGRGTAKRLSWLQERVVCLLPPIDTDSGVPNFDVVSELLVHSVCWKIVLRRRLRG